MGQEAEFYIVNNIHAGWGLEVAAAIVRPQPRGWVVFKRAVAAGATSVVEECPSSGGGLRPAAGGGGGVRVILITRSSTVTATRTAMAKGQPRHDRAGYFCSSC